MSCVRASEYGKWNNVSNNGGSSQLQKHNSYFVQLAPESPVRDNFEPYIDESSFDSIHNQETDVCKDSSDDDFSDDDSSTELFEDIEFDVNSSSSDVNDFSDISSSGTDDYFADTKYTRYGFLKSSDDSDEIILADTEEDSDGSIDLELGQADYWKCVKCNNLQNNPFYRYCEKCYQVRKSLFPPRPRRPKKLKAINRKRKMAEPSQRIEPDISSECDGPPKKKLAMPNQDDSVSMTTAGSTSCLKNGNQSIMNDKLNSENSKHASSVGESSCNKVMSVETIKAMNVDICAENKVSDSIEIGTSDEKLDSSQDKNSLDIKLENKIIQNVYKQELRFKRFNELDSKDSGLSSCQESSQELSPFGDGYLARSSSTISSSSADSQPDYQLSQASTQIQQDSDDETDAEDILTRVEEFTKERSDKQSSTIQPQTSDLHQTTSDGSLNDINDSNLGICRFCMVNPKNGVFVHSNCLHLCCCYKCAIKVWKKRKSCPICNCKIKNVSKLFVH